MAFVRTDSETETEQTILFSVAALSTICGLTIAYLMRQETHMASIYFLGLAHAIAFVPAVIVSNATKIKVVIAGIACALFPYWGFFLLGILSGGFGAPLANSIVWGLFVAVMLKRPLAILIFLAIGIVSNAALILFMSQDSTNGGFAETIGFWYILTLPVFPILHAYRWDWPPMLADSCESCGYSLVGLPKHNYCPECGHKKGDQSAALEDSI